MSLANLALPSGTYSLTCAGIWFACKRTDSLLSVTGRRRIAAWLKSSAASGERLSSALLFTTLFTAFFGRKIFSFGFFARAIAISVTWLCILLSIFLTHIDPPFFIHFHRESDLFSHGYTHSWGSTLGVIVFDSKYEYAMPIITPCTFFILCNLLGDILTLIICHQFFKILSKRETIKNYVIIPIFAFISAAAISFIFISISHTITLLYVGRLHENDFWGVLKMTIESYTSAIKFPHGRPYKVYAAIPVLSTMLTLCWMLLFIFSVSILKFLFLIIRIIGIASPLLDLSRKPIEAVGWIMILVMTPAFWAVTFVRSDVMTIIESLSI